MLNRIGMMFSFLAAIALQNVHTPKHIAQAASVYRSKSRRGSRGAAKTTYGHCSWVRGDHGKHPATPLPGELRSKSKVPNKAHWSRRNADKRERRALRAAGVVS